MTQTGRQYIQREKIAEVGKILKECQTNLTFEVSMEALKQANCERNLDRRRLVGFFFFWSFLLIRERPLSLQYGY